MAVGGEYVHYRGFISSFSMKILVTGGAGFIGSHLTDRLITEGHRVAVVDDLSIGSRGNLNPDVVFYECDINDKKIERIFTQEKPDIVYHLAFNVNVPRSVQDPLFDARSLTGSINVFYQAARTGVQKIIFASSAFVYGNSERLPLTEQHPIQPTAPYAISKIAAENYLRFFRQAYNAPFVILRYATVYGPRQVGGAMADYMRKISAHERAEMYGDGTFTRDYVYIDDVVDANMLALAVPKDYPEPVFNIGSSQETTLNEVYAIIARHMGMPDNKPIYRSQRPGELERYAVSFEKARQELGWQPTISLHEGLTRIIRQKNTISLIMAVRNEKGGLMALMKEFNEMSDYPLELIFVEGGSTDGTYEELERLARLPSKHRVLILKQDGIGKKDAVVKGLRAMTGDYAFVYDADGEIAVEELPIFFENIKANSRLFLNSTRFKLPMQKKMHWLNIMGNKIFVILMSMMTGSRLTDPLCGLKGTRAGYYREMMRMGVFDNDIDRFAEFDQLFGAKRLGLAIKELPVVYRDRRYGASKVQRFKVGWQLLKRIGWEVVAA